MSESNLTRRSFAVAAAAAPALLSAQSRGSQIRVGWVGLGNRGGKHIHTMVSEAKGDAVIKAICDTYTPRMALTKDKLVSDGQPAPETYDDFYKMLDDSSIDAVFIMTPEHLHRDMAIAALQAGKHVYCEKPLTHTIEEGFDILQAVEASGKKFQVGTQRRSSKIYQKAKEIYESGVLGEVVYARAYWYRNRQGEGTPAWRYEIPADSTPDNTDYKAFLGEAPETEFDKNRYFQWRLFWDYSGGISTDLLVHQTDAIHMIMGHTHCKSVMCQGGVHAWRDGREVPDVITAGFEYPDHLHINYSVSFANAHFGYGEELMGRNGVMIMKNLSDLYVYGEDPRMVAKGEKPAPEMHFNDQKDFGQGNPTNEHIRNFLDAVMGKAELNCPAITGHQAAVTGHLATLSYRNDKKVFWDNEQGRYHFS